MLRNRTAGDPDREEVIFTELPVVEIAERVTHQGTPVSDKTVTRWLKDIGLGLRKMSKDIAGGSSPDREAQFDRISALIEEYTNAGNPYFSMDTKAKEQLGRFYRAGRIHTNEPLHAFDHDFPGWGDGKVIPHAIYDAVRNRWHSTLGLSHDTSQFAVESLHWYWNRIGKQC